MAAAFEALFPILNEADAYYERKDYMYDKMAGGRELHAKLVPAALAYLAAREKTEGLQEQFKEMIDRHQLARIEKTEGKSVRWHARYTSMMAKKAVDLLPRDPRKPGDLKAFDAALASFGEAVKEFDTAARTSGKSSSMELLAARHPRQAARDARRDRQGPRQWHELRHGLRISHHALQHDDQHVEFVSVIGMTERLAAPSRSGGWKARPVSQGKWIQVSCDTSVMKVSTSGLPIGLA